jgi:hypothetical protein
VRRTLLLLVVLVAPLMAQSPRPVALIASITDKHGSSATAPLDQNIVVSADGKETHATSAQRLEMPVLYVVMVDSSAQFSSTKGLDNDLREIQDLVANQYRIQFAADPVASKKSSLKVKVEGQPDLRVIAPKHLPE